MWSLKLASFTPQDAFKGHHGPRVRTPSLFVAEYYSPVWKATSCPSADGHLGHVQVYFHFICRDWAAAHTGG